jgi:hypothetical protein
MFGWMLLVEVRLRFWKAFAGQLLCLQCLSVHCGVTAEGLLHISSRPWAVFLVRIVVCCCDCEARCSMCISSIWQLMECSTLGFSFSLSLHTAAWAGGDPYLTGCLSKLFPHHIPQLWKVIDYVSFAMSRHILNGGTNIIWGYGLEISIPICILDLFPCVIDY